MKKLLAFLVALVFIVSAINAATTYTTVASGDWSNPAVWDVMPPNPIPVGDIVIITTGHTITITNSIFNDGTITNFGTINNTSIIWNDDGTIINNGTLINNGAFFNSSTVNNNSGGTFFNNSSFNNFLIFNNSGTVNNNSGTFWNGTLSRGGGTVNNSGTFVNSTGRINNLGGSIFYSCVTITGVTVITPLSGCPSAAPIPTLSEWGLILLSMSLSILGIVGIRQRVLA